MSMLSKVRVTLAYLWQFFLNNLMGFKIPLTKYSSSHCSSSL